MLYIAILGVCLHILNIVNCNIWLCVTSMTVLFLLLYVRKPWVFPTSILNDPLYYGHVKMEHVGGKSNAVVTYNFCALCWLFCHSSLYIQGLAVAFISTNIFGNNNLNNMFNSFLNGCLRCYYSSFLKKRN